MFCRFSDTIESSTDMLILSCTFEGIPTPQIQWFTTSTSDGSEKELSKSERFTICY